MPSDVVHKMPSGNACSNSAVWHASMASVVFPKPPSALDERMTLEQRLDDGRVQVGACDKAGRQRRCVVHGRPLVPCA